jgi:type VI secretion system protein ImpB
VIRQKNESSVAPKERINISYRPATGSAKESVELPFKLLVLGEFATAENNDSIEERELVEVNDRNFDEVMSAFDLSIDFTVDNKMADDGSVIDVALKIDQLSDFSPDSIVEQVPELKAMLQLRDALKALKGPLGNSPQMRKRIQALLSDEDGRTALRKEIGVDK